MNETLEIILKKFNPTIARRGGTELRKMNRSSMAGILSELGFKLGAEVGVAEGNHAEVICKAIPGVKLHLVDIWEKYDGYHEYADPDKCFLEAIEKLKSYDISVHKKFSMDAVRDFEDNSLDFVYIDAGHDFKNVAQDICEWSKKVRVGGIVFGHDYKRSYRRFRVDVKDVVDAYMYAHGIRPWFILANDIRDPNFGPDNPGWMFVRQETDRL